MYFREEWPYKWKELQRVLVAKTGLSGKISDFHSSCFFSARSDETKFKPTSGCQPNWQLSIATSQWWQQCQKGGSAERTTAKRRPLHASGGAAAIPLPAGPQSVTETWAAPSAILHAPWGWSRASPPNSTRSKPKQRTTSDRSTAAERQWDCNRWVARVMLNTRVCTHTPKKRYHWSSAQACYHTIKLLEWLLESLLLLF